MIKQNRINDYTAHLSRMLRPLPYEEREEIVEEIRAHLVHRAKENRLEEAISLLGPPQSCARGFIDELKLQQAFIDGGIAKTSGTLFSLASRRVLAAIGLFLSMVFFALAVGFALTAITKVVAPAYAGLWIDEGQYNFIFGVSNLENTADMKEVLSFWLIPVASILCVFALVCGQWLGRYFITKMAKKVTRLEV